MHKIFKLCGSPSEEYWQRTKLPYATSFKPQNSYQRQIANTFNNFPSTALTLVDTLLSMEPEQRGSATAALKSEVILNFFSSILLKKYIVLRILNSSISSNNY